jgi:hypothetical protein
MAGTAGLEPAATLFAKRVKVSATCAARILRLNYLAPDIIQVILDGREPSGRSLTVLTGTLPTLWEEQRRLLGFASPIGVN